MQLDEGKHFTLADSFTGKNINTLPLTRTPQRTQLQTGRAHLVFSLSISGEMLPMQHLLGSYSQHGRVCACVCAYGDADVKLYNHKGEGEGPGDVVDRAPGSNWLPQQSDFREGGTCVRFAAPFIGINSLFRMTRNLRCPHGSAAIGRWQKETGCDRTNTHTEGISFSHLLNFTIFPFCRQNKSIPLSPSVRGDNSELSS